MEKKRDRESSAVQEHQKKVLKKKVAEIRHREKQEGPGSKVIQNRNMYNQQREFTGGLDHGRGALL